MAAERVVVNVGGTRYETTISTLRVVPGSRIAALAEAHAREFPAAELFIDRDGAPFATVLTLLRHIAAAAAQPLPPAAHDAIASGSIAAELAYFGLGSAAHQACFGGAAEATETRVEPGRLVLVSRVVPKGGATATFDMPPALAELLQGGGSDVPSCSWSCGSGQMLEATPSVPLGAEWTIDVWVRLPLPPAPGQWRTLCRGAAGDHQIIVDYKDQDSLGMFDNVSAKGFRPSGLRLKALAPGWHRFTVVGCGGKQKFVVDRSQQHVGSTDKQSQTEITWIGNYSDGNQPWGTFCNFTVIRRALSDKELFYSSF